MPIAFVQKNNGDSSAASSSQGSFITSTGAGNLLIVMAVCGGNTTMTISDNGATHANWQPLLPATYDATLNKTRAVFAAWNIPSGITLVTVTYGVSSTPRGIVVAEFSGTDTVSAFDQGPASQATTMVNPSSLNVTPSVANELLVQFGVFGTAIGTNHSGWTALNSGPIALYNAGYKIQTSIVTESGIFDSASQYASVDCVTFEPPFVAPQLSEDYQLYIPTGVSY